MGFDPTVTLFRHPSGETSFDIVVRSAHEEDAVYRTNATLFDAGHDQLLGRGTRVWKAARLDKDSGQSTAKTVVLKDSWVDADRKSTRLNSSHSGESRMPSSA